MSFLSETMRRAVLRVRDRTFTTAIQVLTRQLTPNQAGGQSEQWTVEATVSGRLRQARPMEYLEIRGGQQFTTGMWLAMLPVSTVVDLTHRLRVGNRVFSVVGADAGRSDALVQVVQCIPLTEIA